MARQKPEKIYHIAVVGLSGTENERGATGVGKSCLCNRFLRPHEDDYFHDHISVISSSDFSGRIVNNDHFLFWGQINKKYDGDSITFRVIEQTEFIDDSSFSPLRGSNTHNYYKRAAVTNLKSAEKVMYICKDQVGDETNFEQKILPDGKFPVDGFLVVYDVSKSSGHDKQTEFLSKLQSQLSKAKRPIVVVATKFDEPSEMKVRDAQQFANKVKAPLIEVSSQEGVNVDLAFFTLASKIDKRGSPREISYKSANESRQKVINRAVDDYKLMLDQDVTNYHDIWVSKKRAFQSREVFKKVVELIGTKNAKKQFTRHTNRLRQQHQQNKQKLYLGRLPGALEDIFPDLQSIGNRDWTECRHALPNMPNFEKWFIILHNDTSWRESEYIDTDKLLIPYDILEGNETECENCFGDHVNRLNAAKRKERMKEDFKKLLESLPNVVLPSRALDEDVVQDALVDHECFKELDDGTRTAIYNIHLEDIRERAITDFHELLAEKYELLSNMTISPHPQQEVEKVIRQLQDDSRYGKLSEMAQDRFVMLINYILFVHNPSSENCFYEKRCMDKLIQYCIESNVTKSPIKETLGSWDDFNNKLSVVVMGEDGLAVELEADIKSQAYDGDYTLDKVLYSLDLRTVEGDILAPGNQLETDRFTPKGCICVFTSLEGFQYVRSCLERTILSGDQRFNTITLREMAVVLMFGRSTSPEADTAQVREEAFNLCSRLNNCQIVNVPPDNTTFWQGKKFSESQIQDALRCVVAGQKHRSGSRNQTESDRGQKPDNPFRIGLCMPCGDPFNPDLVLSPVTSHACVVTPNEENSITCDMFLIDAKCRVEFEVASYHQMRKLRESRVRHGYILVYAAQRKASIQMMKWFLKLVKPIPTLVVAVREDINLAAEGITEGNKVVDQMENASLVTVSCSSFKDQTVIYNSFLKAAYDKRKETEKMYQAEADDRGPLSPGRRPPMELPPPAPDSPQEEAPTPTSEDNLFYDEVNQTQRRGSAKTSNEVVFSQSERRGSEPVRPSGALSRSLEGLYGVVDKSQKSGEKTTPETPDSDELYAVVDRPSKTSTPKPALESSAPEGLYADVHRDHRPHAGQKNVTEGSGGSMTYASVDEMRGGMERMDISQPEDSDEGLQDNPLYQTSGSTFSPDPKPRAPPTAPKPGKLDLSKYPVRMEALMRPIVNRPNDLPVWHHRRPPQAPHPQTNNHPPPFASPESDEGAGYASPADALPFDQVRRVISSSFHGSGGSGGTSNPSAIYAQPHEHLPRLQKPPKPRVPMKVFSPPVVPPPTTNDAAPEPPERNAVVKRPPGPTQHSQEELDAFLDGLKKLVQNSLDTSCQELEDTTPGRKKVKVKKVKEKDKKNKRKTPYPPPAAQKKPKPPLEQLILNENGIPTFIEQCVYRIEDEGLTQEGIYRVSGKAADIETIIKMFDENQLADLGSIENLSANTIASALKQFFKNLPEPIIPYTSQDRMISDYKDFKSEEEFVQRLPEYLEGLSHVKVTVLTYMMRHIKRITEYSEENLMNAENISICWWPSMLHPQSKSFEDLANEVILSTVFKHILEHSQELFNFT